MTVPLPQANNKLHGNSLIFSHVDHLRHHNRCPFQIFRDGSPTPSEYDGPREAAGIVSFLKKQGGPAVSTLSDAATVTKFRTLDDEKDVVGEPLALDYGVAGWLHLNAIIDYALGRLELYFTTQ